MVDIDPKKRRKPKKSKEELGLQQAALRTPEEVAKSKVMRETAQARLTRDDATARRVTATGEPIPVGATPQERAEIITKAKEVQPLVEQQETQEDIIERERLRREGGEEVVTEEIPQEVQEPITEQVIAEEEPTVLDKVRGAYDWVNTLGGIVPDLSKVAEEQGSDISLGVLPIGIGGGSTVGVKSGKAILSSAKVNTGARAVKVWDKARTFLKSKVATKLGAYGTLGYVWWSERTLSNIDSALSQVRESLTLPVQLAAANKNYVSAFEMVTDYENDINEYESMVKDRENLSLAAKFTGRTLPIYQRIKKLDTAVLLARNQIAKLEAQDITLSDEDTAIMLGEMNKLLDSMGEPSKWYSGII